MAKIIDCNATNQIIIKDILDAINAVNNKIENTNTEIAKYATIRTKRDGNILYMTDNGTTP